MKNNSQHPAETILALEISKDNPVAFSIGAQATADELLPFTGLSDAALRRLERDINPATQKPWIPPARKNLRLTKPTLVGVLAWRENKIKASDQRMDHFSFPSMESCEGATGITKTLQQIAKNKGCPAFRGPRVYLLDLIRWIFKEAAAGTTAEWGKKNEELDAKLKQVKLDTELRILRSSAEVEKYASEFAAICFGGWKRLTLEAPRDFEQRSRAFIKKSMADKYNQFLALARSSLKNLESDPVEQPKESLLS